LGEARRARGVSTATSLIAIMAVMFLVAGLIAYTNSLQQGFIAGAGRSVSQAGEVRSELVRIYIHPRDESNLNSEPVATLLNPSSREVVLRQLVAVDWSGGVVRAGLLPQEITLPPSSKTTIQLSALGLSYGSFIDAVRALRAVYLVTGRGNSFGSSFGPPPRELLEGQVNLHENSSFDVVYYVVSTQENFTFMNAINGTGGTAYVAVNTYVFDRAGELLGGMENGNRFSGGAIVADDIPLDGAGVYRVPIWSYFLVPKASSQFNIRFTDKSVYGQGYTGTARLSYVEVVGIYPREWFSAGGSASAPAPYMRCGVALTIAGKTYTGYYPYPMAYPRTQTASGQAVSQPGAVTYFAWASYSTARTTQQLPPPPSSGTQWIDVGSPVMPIKLRVSKPCEGSCGSTCCDWVKVRVLDENGNPIPLKVLSSQGYCGLEDGGKSVKCCDGPSYNCGRSWAEAEVQAAGFMRKFAIQYQTDGFGWEFMVIQVYYRRQASGSCVYAATLPAPASEVRMLSGAAVAGTQTVVIDRVKTIDPSTLPSLMKIDAPIVLINRVYYVADVSPPPPPPPPPQTGGSRGPVVEASCVLVEASCGKEASPSPSAEGFADGSHISLRSGRLVCIYRYSCGLVIREVAT